MNIGYVDLYMNCSSIIYTGEFSSFSIYFVLDLRVLDKFILGDIKKQGERASCCKSEMHVRHGVISKQTSN